MSSSNLNVTRFCLIQKSQVARIKSCVFLYLYNDVSVKSCENTVKYTMMIIFLKSKVMTYRDLSEIKNTRDDDVDFTDRGEMNE